MQECWSVYCDESGHLEHDQQRVMVLGAIVVPTTKARQLNHRIRQIKLQSGRDCNFEFKWQRLSIQNLPLAQKLLDLYFDTPWLQFRALVIPDKRILHPGEYGRSWDEQYYTWFYTLLKPLGWGLCQEILKQISFFCIKPKIIIL